MSGQDLRVNNKLPPLSPMKNGNLMILSLYLLLVQEKEAEDKKRKYIKKESSSWFPLSRTFLQMALLLKIMEDMLYYFSDINIEKMGGKKYF